MKKKLVFLAAAFGILFGATAMTSSAVLADDLPPWAITGGTSGGSTGGTTGTDTGTGDTTGTP